MPPSKFFILTITILIKSNCFSPYAWSHNQIARFSDGKTVEYRKSTMKKKNPDTLSIATPRLSDSELTRVP